MAKRSATTIDLTGPFFEKDPKITFLRNVHAMLEAMAIEGQEDVRAQIPHRTGRTAAGVVGRTVSLNGHPWVYTTIISQRREFPWVNRGERGFAGHGEAVYRGGKLEAHLHMFRRTAGRLRHSRAVNMAELTRGMN